MLRGGGSVIIQGQLDTAGSRYLLIIIIETDRLVRLTVIQRNILVFAVTMEDELNGGFNFEIVYYWNLPMIITMEYHVTGPSIKPVPIQIVVSLLHIADENQ